MSSVARRQSDILSMIREEAYYFAPQGQTKIINEGWAVYWHSTLMTNYCLRDTELITYCDHHSGTLATSPGRLNPYKLGVELFRDIERRWNTGRSMSPTRDVLLFLLENATLEDWQADVLSIIREEAYYFAPQGQTKIMNEGWASYWHSTIMTTRDRQQSTKVSTSSRP